ncbi:MAG: hypothetical protein ABIQ49_15825 [Gemmatimonadales bacterium]
MTATAGLAVQGAAPTAPTVGDTIWVGRTVLVPPGTTLRPADWDAPDPIERLGPPRITPHGDSADLAYPIVVWRTGALSIELPGPLLLHPGGRIDSLRPESLRLTIGTVLPAAPADSTIAPQPRAGFVPRSSASLLPLLLLLLVAALVLVPLHLLWRRRGRPRPRPELPVPADEAPLERWADAGESRAVVSVAASRLRALIAARLPAAHPGLDTEELLRAAAVRADWPLEELAGLLRTLDEARFGDVGADDALGLARRARELGFRLAPAAA